MRDYHGPLKMQSNMRKCHLKKADIKQCAKDDCNSASLCLYKDRKVATVKY